MTPGGVAAHPILWHPTGPNRNTLSHWGHAGGCRLFLVYWDAESAGRPGGAGWRLTAVLPGLVQEGDRAPYASAPAAKLAAQSILDRWLAKVLRGGGEDVTPCARCGVPRTSHDSYAGVQHPSVRHQWEAPDA
jgi:hypothetical protein